MTEREEIKGRGGRKRAMLRGTPKMESGQSGLCYDDDDGNNDDENNVDDVYKDYVVEYIKL